MYLFSSFVMLKRKLLQNESKKKGQILPLVTFGSFLLKKKTIDEHAELPLNSFAWAFQTNFFRHCFCQTFLAAFNQEFLVTVLRILVYNHDSGYVYK